jgi:3-hydroxyisobutyrate dehydrogenase-like beta-hydroxyacid dehydrogenase
LSAQSPSSTLRAGVIGLGEIGAGVARAVLRAGMPLTVHDVRAEATVPFEGQSAVARSPGELAETSDVTAVAVVTDEQVVSVLRGDSGLLTAAAPGSVLVVLSTIGPDTLDRVVHEAAERGVAVLDCGVSGGTAAAAEGSLVSMVGGDAEVVDRVRPFLDCFSSHVIHMGPSGTGLQAKLARNLVQYASWLAAYEAQVLAEAAGIELAKLAQAIRESDKKIGGASTLMFRRTAAPFGPDDDDRLVEAMRRAAGLAHKDLGAALALGARLGVALPLAEMTDARADALFGLVPDGSERAGGGP